MKDKTNPQTKSPPLALLTFHESFLCTIVLFSFFNYFQVCFVPLRFFFVSLRSSFTPLTSCSPPIPSHTHPPPPFRLRIPGPFAARFFEGGSRARTRVRGGGGSGGRGGDGGDRLGRGSRRVAVRGGRQHGHAVRRRRHRHHPPRAGGCHRSPIIIVIVTIIPIVIVIITIVIVISGGDNSSRNNRSDDKSDNSCDGDGGGSRGSGGGSWDYSRPNQRVSLVIDDRPRRQLRVRLADRCGWGRGRRWGRRLWHGLRGRTLFHAERR